MSRTVTIAVTGHRPNKLWGYDLNNPPYQKLQQLFEQILTDTGCTDAWTGMALGADTVFAHAVLALRDKNLPIRLHCAIPCRGQSSRWSAGAVREYDQILQLADSIVLVTDAPYSPRLMQVRNEYMVNHSDFVIAVWNGTPGGTANCVRYARHRDVQVRVIDPASIINSVLT